MDLNKQRKKAEAFRRMHDRSRILVLVNVWDAMSARAIEEFGARIRSRQMRSPIHNAMMKQRGPAPRS
jgi:hypothetical protein